ncbi:MAG: hypothetical protein MUQ70_03385 [Flavobacteriaceae bacterium]|nr:hypothetical protein [Flavobacteriaceae bacterium]
MNFITRITSICILFFVIQGCEYFNTTTITSKQIKDQSLWNDKDQAPSFEDCNDLEGEDNLTCFKETISDNISYALSQYDFITSEPLDREVVFVIEIDLEGYFSLVNVEDEYDVISKIDSLYTEFESIVASLPQALPAIKTNVGIKVKTKLKLPIRIIASPQE